MEQDITLKEFLREILEPIIDECLERAMNKYINTKTLEPKDDSGVFDMKETAEYLKIINNLEDKNNANFVQMKKGPRS